MATVQSIITSARYDLRDYQKGLVYDNAELLDYLNRMVGVLDSTLASMRSDLVEEEDTSFTLSADTKVVDLSTLNSGLWDSIRSVWIDQDELEKISIDHMRFKRQFRSGTSQPQYWCLSGLNMLFEEDAADDYSLEIYYNKKTGELTLTNDMPYNDIFNEDIREMLVLHAKAKKSGRISRADSFYSDVFRQRAMAENLRRQHLPKYYWLGF